MRYEGFGLAGIGIIVETLTDNRNRTAAEVRSTFSKMAAISVKQVPCLSCLTVSAQLSLMPSALDAETVFEEAIEAGAEDVDSSDEGHEIICAVEELHNLVNALQDSLGEPRAADIIWRAQNDIAVDGEAAEKVVKLVEALDDVDDVQNVYANFDISEEVLQQLSA